jgi:superfamily I DNA/RNA helicase
VALHRARRLARQGKRVLLTTYADTLCANLGDQLDLLCAGNKEQRELIEVSTVHDYAVGLLESIGRTVKPDDDELTEKWLKELADHADYARSPEWYVMEWEHVISPYDIRSLDEYLEVARAGRGSALQERDRRVVWEVFEKLLAKVKEAGITDGATVCRMAREALEDGSIREAPCDAVVVDEMQDLRPQELKFLAVLGGEEPDTLMVVGDMTQRVYVPKFTMRSAGIDVVGRSYRLRVNYRTTRQIKELADDVVAGPSARSRPDGAYSVYFGPPPSLCAFTAPEEESEYVAGAITRLLRNGSYQTHDVAVFARDPKRVDPVAALLEAQGIPTHRLSRQSPPDGHVRIGSMQRAKGLEFKAVFVIGVSGDAVPAPAMVDHLFEPAARDEALERERQMLYVAMTRARDELTVTWTGEPSPFLPSSATEAGVCGAEA